MTTLLIAEHDNASLSEQTAKALAAAAKLGGDVHVLVAGQGVATVAEAAQRRLASTAPRPSRGTPEASSCGNPEAYDAPKVPARSRAWQNDEMSATSIS